MRTVIHGGRRKGTGSIQYQGDRWVATTTEERGAPRRVIGRFAFRHQAERALAEWLASDGEQRRETA